MKPNAWAIFEDGHLIVPSGEWTYAIYPDMARAEMLASQWSIGDVRYYVVPLNILTHDATYKKAKCFCVCHDPKWVRGLEHETRCCKDMVGWMEGEIPPTSRSSQKSSEDKIAVDFQQEPWEDDEYIITIKGKGPVGGTVSKCDAEIIMRWWKTAVKEINNHLTQTLTTLLNEHF